MNHELVKVESTRETSNIGGKQKINKQTNKRRCTSQVESINTFCAMKVPFLASVCVKLQLHALQLCQIKLPAHPQQATHRCSPGKITSKLHQTSL